MNGVDRARPSSEKLYKSKLIGSVSVWCQSCGARGRVSARFVGRSRTIPECRECRKEQ